MDREAAFQALSGLDERYIAEAVSYAPAAGASERKRMMRTKRLITLALAAALLLALGATAYALGIVSMERRVPDPEESFRIRWEENASGYIEWSDAKLAVTFPETAESREIQFRPGWLPEEMESLKSEEWLDRFTAERLAHPETAEHVDAYANITQPLLIESYSMSRFNNGGALLLLYYTPGEITEEHWNRLNVDVLSFHGSQHFDERDIPELDMHIDARDIDYDYVLLSNEEKGWIVEICGQLGMDTVRKVAENLEIRETGNTLTQADFQNKFLFIDGGVG